MGQGAVITEVGAGGADQDAVVNPVADPDADAQQLTLPGAQEGAILYVDGKALGRARNLNGGQRNLLVGGVGSISLTKKYRDIKV